MNKFSLIDYDIRYRNILLCMCDIDVYGKMFVYKDGKMAVKMKKMEWSKQYFSGIELFALKIADNSMFLVSNKDGNLIQRDYDEWDIERENNYKDSLKGNFHHNPFYIVEWNKKWYVLDGQHRITVILEHVKSNLGSSISDKISIKLFEIVLIKFEGTETEFVKYSSNIFLKLNNPNDLVSSGSLFKSYIQSANPIKSKKTIDIFEEIYDIKSKKGKVDWIFEIVGVSLFLLDKKTSFEKIKNLKDSVIKYLESNSDKISKNLDSLISFINFLKKEKIYANNSNTNKKAPNSHIFFAMFLTFTDKKKNEIRLSKTGFGEVTSFLSWKDSKKITRTPQAIHRKYKILSQMDAKKTLERIVEDELQH